MPIVPLSSRQATVSYAIDLLKAHQIRRENVFLHTQLKTCLAEIKSLRGEVQYLKSKSVEDVSDEINSLKSSYHLHEDTLQQVVAKALQTETLLWEQMQALQGVLQAQKTTQTEVSVLRTSILDRDRLALSESKSWQQQLKSVQIELQDQTAAQQQHNQQMLINLANLQTEISTKANAETVDQLEGQVGQLIISAPPQRVLRPPVSHVSNTFSVPDESESVPTSRDNDKGDRSASSLPHHVEPDSVVQEITEADDLDLDANAYSFSYAGHHERAKKLPDDSFQMLPPSSAAATQLARVKTLKQRRFDEWSAYYQQGIELIKDLPAEFEETVVRNFVAGMYSDKHKRQCQQWLDQQGWTWANVKSFGDLSSQVVDDRAKVVPMSLQSLSSIPIKKRLHAARGAAGTQETTISTVRKRKYEQDRELKPFRRSQRLVEKKSLTMFVQPEEQERHAKKQKESVAQSQDPQNGKSTQSTQLDQSLMSKTASNVAKNVPPVAKRATTRPSKQRLSSMSQSTPTKDATSKPPKSNKAAVERTSKSILEKKRRLNSARNVKIGKRKDLAPVVVEHPLKRPRALSESTVSTTVDNASHVLPLAKARGISPVGDSSNDEGFLYHAGPVKHRTSRMDGHKKSGSPLRSGTSKRAAAAISRQRRKQKGRHLPLPPPPEIPILPTTDEE